MLKHFSLSGTATRKQYWLTMLVTILWAVLGTTAIVLFEQWAIGNIVYTVSEMHTMSLITHAIWYGVFLAPTAILYVLVFVRRVRDAVYNVLWAVSSVIPVVSIVALFVLGALPTKK